MTKTVILLLLAICSANGASAQQKQAAGETQTNSPQFKKKTPSTTAKKHSAVKSPEIFTAEKAETKLTATTAPENDNQSKASAIIAVDFRNMPADVQKKINENKVNGKYQLEGISKAFLVEIKSCTTDADQKKTLSFLKSKKGFIQSQFIEAGKVKIIVDPLFDSAELKETMSSNGIRFNFLNRSYLLKN